MSKPVCLVTAPVATRSGYGAHARDIVHSLIDLDRYDIKILPVRWGNTPQNALDAQTEMDKKILKRILPQPHLDKQPELHIHVVIPNEYQTHGKYNIGITAGGEMTVVKPEWIEGVNRMDLNIVPSQFSKDGFKNTKWAREQENKQTGEKQEMSPLQMEKPMEVLFEGYDENIYGTTERDKYIDEELGKIKEDFCFLFVGHWLQGGLGNDRKDVGALLKVWYETFGNKHKRPALILKTQGATPSVLDRYEIIGKMKSIRDGIKDMKNPPKIYLLHGDLTDKQMNSLYQHPKVKAMINCTHGEGFGRPILEFSTTGKPVIVSNWSGHLDFLKKDAVTFLQGRLTDTPRDAFPENIHVESAKWFTCDYFNVRKVLIDVFKNYRKYNKKALRQKVYAKNLTLNKMTEELGKILDKYVPEFPKQVDLKLPTLKKIDGGQTGAIKPPPNQQSTEIKLPKLKRV